MMESSRLESIRLESSVVLSIQLTGKSIWETHRKNHTKRQTGMVEKVRQHKRQEEASLQYSYLVSHHALRTRKVHVIFLSFRVQIL